MPQPRLGTTVSPLQSLLLWTGERSAWCRSDFPAEGGVLSTHDRKLPLTRIASILPLCPASEDGERHREGKSRKRKNSRGTHHKSYLPPLEVSTSCWIVVAFSPSWDLEDPGNFTERVHRLRARIHDVKMERESADVMSQDRFYVPLSRTEDTSEDHVEKSRVFFFFFLTCMPLRENSWRGNRSWWTPVGGPELCILCVESHGWRPRWLGIGEAGCCAWSSCLWSGYSHLEVWIDSSCNIHTIYPKYRCSFIFEKELSLPLNQSLE